MSKSLRWLFCFFFAALLPAMILRDFTPSNELRYLSIADEAIRDGHLFAFTSHGAPYADKPPLYLWIVMAGKLLFGSHCMGFLALFSFFPALVILRTMDRWVRSVLDERARIAGVTMTMTSGLFLGLAVFLRMDMLMCMFIVLSLHAFWRLYSGEGSSRRAAILFPLYAFLALFTKGPVGLLVPLSSTVVFLVVQRQWRQIGRYWGWRTWGILLAGCAVWFTAVWAEGGTEYLDNLLFHQTLDRAVDAFHHKAPFYFYGVSVWYSLAPWSLFLAVVFAAAWRQHVRLGELERFFLSVALSTFVMLSLFSSKLAVYLAPAFPFVVYAGGLLFARVRMNGWMQAALALPAVIWTLALPAVAVAASMPATAFVANGWCFAAGALLSAGGVATLWFLFRRRDIYRSVQALAGGLLCALFVGGFALPRFNGMLGYGKLCRVAMEVAAEQPDFTGYYVWKVRRPENMDVYLGEPITEISVDEAMAGQAAGGVLLLSERKLRHDETMQRFVAGLAFTRSVDGYLVCALPAVAETADFSQETVPALP